MAVIGCQTAELNCDTNLQPTVFAMNIGEILELTSNATCYAMVREVSNSQRAKEPDLQLSDVHELCTGQNFCEVDRVRN